MRLKWFLIAWLCAALAIGSVAVPSPAGLGTVGGQVFDIEGKTVARAHVTLQASERDQLQTTETNTQGHFWFRFLPEGQYSVRASDQGRVSEWRQNVWVSPGHETEVTLHLRRRQKSNVSIAFPPLHGLRPECDLASPCLSGPVERPEGQFCVPLQKVTTRNLGL